MFISSESIKASDLFLNLFHNLYFTFKKFSQGNDGIIFALILGVIAQLDRLLLNFCNQPFCDLLFGPWNHKVKELFIRNFSLMSVRHKVNKKSALSFR